VVRRDECTGCTFTSYAKHGVIATSGKVTVTAETSVSTGNGGHDWATEEYFGDTGEIEGLAKDIQVAAIFREDSDSDSQDEDSLNRFAQ